MADSLDVTQFDPSGYTDFNDAYNLAIRQIARQKLGLDSQQQGGVDRLNQDFTKNSADLGESRDKSITSLQDNLASNGIGRSGANLTGQRDIQQGYLKSYDSLQTQRNRSIEDLIRSVQDAHQGLLDKEEQLGFQKTEAERSKALQDAQLQAAQQVNQAQLNSQQPYITSTGDYVTPDQASDFVDMGQGVSVRDETPPTVQAAAYKKSQPKSTTGPQYKPPVNAQRSPGF